jgi:predicted enzyme related to lactoylglutathione lyase
MCSLMASLPFRIDYNIDPQVFSQIYRYKQPRMSCMSEMNHLTIGTIGWVDLTVTQAEAIRDFYQRVAGWRPEPVNMGGYADYSMIPPASDQPAAGVCHARGVNVKIPPVWLIYITVANLYESLKACLDLGGEVVDGPRGEPGQGRMVVVRDPAGAVCALWETAA